jgi:hypothetical protein
MTLLQSLGKTAGRMGAALLLVASMGSIIVPNMASADSQNCDANAVIWCGAGSVGSLQNSYSNGDTHNKAYSIQDIYNWFGISSGDINSMGSYEVNGYVTKTGDVYANGKLVATGALTAGRQNIAGSTQRKYGATTFYTRTPSVSFLDSQLSAMVDMQNGKFQFAILNSCGNPIKANAVAQPAPKPTPTPTYTPTPTPTPVPTPTPTPTPVQTEVSCVSLIVTQPDKDNRPNTFDFTITPSDNAQVTGYIFTFSDEAQPVNSSSATVERDDITQPITVYGQVVSDQGTTPAGQCQIQVTVATTTVVPAPSPSPTPTTEVLSASTMPQTGASDLLGDALGVSGMAVSARMYLRSRRNALSAKRKK